MLDELTTTHHKQPKTLGADKGYDDGQFFRNLEALDIQPHIPLVKESRHPKDVPYKKQIPDIRARRRMKRRMTTRAFRISQRCRNIADECFGWLKTIAGLDRCRTMGRWKLRQFLELAAATDNLIRLKTLAPAT